MKFLYDICDFRKITTKGFFYCDRTDCISLLEEEGEYLLFLRSRRFGKSLLLSMGNNYYDVARKDQFTQLLGNLQIGQKPTPLHHQYFILQLDFSWVDPTGTADDIKRALHDHINNCIKEFMLYYKNLLPDTKIEIDPDNALNSIASLKAHQSTQFTTITH